MRLRVSTNTRNEINFGYVKKFHQNQALIKQQQRHSAPCTSILKQTSWMIEQNDGSTAFTAMSDSHKETAYLVEDALFYNFLLLEMATVWPDLRFENCLNSLEMLCIAWYNKANDLFDDCIQLMANYWKR